MSIVDFNSSTWLDSWFRKLPPNAKLLFIYFWTNDHKNVIGIYPIDLEVVAFETGLSLRQIQEYLPLLHPKVQYDAQTQTVWVQNYVRHQFMRTGNLSPQIKSAIEKALGGLRSDPFMESFLKHYASWDFRGNNQFASERHETPNPTLWRGYPYPPGGGKGGGEGSEEEEKERGAGKEGEEGDESAQPNFDTFWSAYPRKVAKERARKVWNRIKPTLKLTHQILNAVETAKTSEEWLKEGGRYIPYPASYLNGRRWEDEHYPTSNGGPQPDQARVLSSSRGIVAWLQLKERKKNGGDMHD